ncbi:DUF6191 domain-containing protein [Streptomyces sp. NPDC055013]
MTTSARPRRLVPDDGRGRAGRAGWLPWRNVARQGQISATGFEQLHASFSPGKQSELEERRSALVMRDEDEDGAPPRSTVDLGRGTAVIRLGTADLSGDHQG